MKDQRQSPYAVVSLANHVPPPAKCAYIYRDIPFAGNGGMQLDTILGKFMGQLRKVQGWYEAQCNVCAFLKRRYQFGDNIHEPDPPERISF